MMIQCYCCIFAKIPIISNARTFDIIKKYNIFKYINTGKALKDYDTSDYPPKYNFVYYFSGNDECNKLNDNDIYLLCDHNFIPNINNNISKYTEKNMLSDLKKYEYKFYELYTDICIDNGFECIKKEYCLDFE